MGDLASRPFHLTVETLTRASAAELYRAWTQDLGRWLGVPGSVEVRAELGGALRFETEHDFGAGWSGAPQVVRGRFVRLEADRVVELTWDTGVEATGGRAPTVLTVEIEPQGPRTLLRLMHAGFSEAAARDHHHELWSALLEDLDRWLAHAMA